MTYVIKAFDVHTGTLTIALASGNLISITVPVANSEYLNGEELHAFVAGFIPQEHILKEPVNADAILAMCAEPTELSYSDLRRLEYPPSEMYLDAVAKDDTTAIQLYKNLCLAVKAKYPKPIQELVSEEVLKARREL